MNSNVREWCKRQCEIQHATTPGDFLNMGAAWEYMSNFAIHNGNLSVMTIRNLGYFVDPVANPSGRFRIGPAVFMNGGTACQAQHIEYQLIVLRENLSDMTAGMVYQQLMWIHPFKDGNGRVGALVYNWLNGTLDNPIDPPDYR